MTAFTMTDIPQEILHHIFKYLEYHDFLNFRATCNHIYHISCDSALWKQLYTYKTDYLTDTNYYKRFLKRSQDNVFILSLWKHMSQEFHVLPYFLCLQQSFGIHMIEYCCAKLRDIPQFEHLTLKYYIAKTKRTVNRLFYIHHFMNLNPDNLLLNVLYIGFLSNSDLYPWMANTYIDQMNQLIKEMQSKIDPAATYSNQVKQVLKVFFEEWQFQVDREHFNSIDHACLHRCLESKRGMPILLSIILHLIGKSVNIDFKMIGFPGKFMMSFEDNSNVYYIDPSDYVHQPRFLPESDLIRDLMHIGMSSELERQEVLRPVDYSYIVERCLNNIMLCISQVPIRSLNWYSAIYTCSWCCFAVGNDRVISSVFLFEMMENAFCEDFITVYQLSNCDKEAFLPFYYRHVTDHYGLDFDYKRLRFERLYDKMHTLPLQNTEHYSFKKDLNGLDKDTMVAVAKKIIRRDLLPTFKDLSHVQCLFNIGDVVHHEKYG